MKPRVLLLCAATVLLTFRGTGADDGLNLRGLTRAQVIEQLGQPSEVGDGRSLDEGALAYDTREGRLTVYFARESDTVIFWYPGDMRKTVFERATSSAGPVASESTRPSSDYQEFGTFQETYEAAVRLQNEGKLPAAHVAFLRALKFDPNHAESWLRNAQVTHEEGLAYPQSVRTYLRNALTRGRQSPHGPLSPARESEARRLLARVEAGLPTNQPGSPPEPSGTPSAASSGSHASQPPTAAGCQETLAYLSTRLPAIDNEELANIRRIILGTRVSDVAANMTAEGVPLAQAASLILQQARQNQDVLDESKTCAVESFNGSKADLAAALDRRDYDVQIDSGLGQRTTIREMAGGPSESNVFRSCLRAFIAADMSKIATDETAVQLTCRATRRP
jgi:hypothetical protein